MIIGVALGALFITTSCFCAPKAPQSSKMDAWKPNAEKASTPLAVGTFFLSLGIVTGFAAPVIPWMSVGATASSSYFSAGVGVIATSFLITSEASSTIGFTSYSVINYLGMIGAIIAYVRMRRFLNRAFRTF